MPAVFCFQLPLVLFLDFGRFRHGGAADAISLSPVDAACPCLLFAAGLVRLRILLSRGGDACSCVVRKFHGIPFGNGPTSHSRHK